MGKRGRGAPVSGAQGIAAGREGSAMWQYFSHASPPVDNWPLAVFSMTSCAFNWA
jgi:hypothetical protein